jgi:hypothetical protein
VLVGQIIISAAAAALAALVALLLGQGLLTAFLVYSLSGSAMLGALTIAIYRRAESAQDETGPD